MSYVCLCNPTTDSQVLEESKKCINVEQVKTNLAICQRCKSCSAEICKIFNHSKQN